MMLLIHRIIDDSLWVYLFALLLSYLFARSYSPKKVKGIFFPAMVFLPLFFVSAFRCYVGTDYYQYSVYQIPIIRKGLQFVEYVNYDLLFVGLVKFFNFFTASNFPIFFVLSFGVIFYGIWIYRDSPRPSVSILLYFFTCIYASSLNIMRQGFGVSLFWLGFSYWVKKERKLAIVFFICALLMHRTSILFLPILFLYDKCIGMKKKCCICLGLLLFSSSFHVANDSLGILNVLGVGRYFNSVLDTGDYNLRFLLPIALLFVIDWKYKISSVSESHFVYSNCLFFTLAIICFSPAIPLASRVIYMFLPVVLIYVPLMRNSAKNGRLWVLAIVAYFMLVFYKQIVVDNVHQTLPYNFIWQLDNVDLSIFKTSRIRSLY